MDLRNGKKERALKHWMIAASPGNYFAMDKLRSLFERGFIRGTDTMDSILAAYNNYCAEMRSNAYGTELNYE